MIRHLVLVSTLVFGLHAQAESCATQAEELVLKIDAVWAELTGPYQGDYPESPIDVVQTDKSAKSVQTFKVDVEHTNEDGEDWYNTYEVKFAVPGCYLKSYKFIGSK